MRPQRSAPPVARKATGEHLSALGIREGKVGRVRSLQIVGMRRSSSSTTTASQCRSPTSWVLYTSKFNGTHVATPTLSGIRPVSNSRLARRGTPVSTSLHRTPSPGGRDPFAPGSGRRKGHCRDWREGNDSMRASLGSQNPSTQGRSNPPQLPHL